MHTLIMRIQKQKNTSGNSLRETLKAATATLNESIRESKLIQRWHPFGVADSGQVNRRVNIQDAKTNLAFKLKQQSPVIPGNIHHKGIFIQAITLFQVNRHPAAMLHIPFVDG